MAFTRFATSEPWDPASGERLNKLGDELQEQINDCLYIERLNSVDILDYAINSVERGRKKTVRCMGAINSPQNIVDAQYTILKLEDLSDAWICIYARDIRSSNTYLNVMIERTWTGWQQIATTTNYTAINSSTINFYNGFEWWNNSGVGGYVKTGDIVKLNMLLVGEKGITGQKICNLPYIPKSAQYFSFASGSGNMYIIRTSTDGTLWFDSGNIPTSDYWIIDISYICV